MRARRVSRTRLARRIGGALDSGGVMLSAGAGCGKTTAIEQALAASGRPAAWVGCSHVERSPGQFLLRVVSAIAAAAPGASDALSERLATAPEQVDPLAAMRELISELSRLLLEPLVVVVDDAEQLDGARGSLELLGELMRADLPLLRVAVATRRRLDLRLAKPRAEGRLTELTASDLAFDAEECAALLRERGGRDPSSDAVDEVMEATEGWPLGVALSARFVAQAENGAAAPIGPGSAAELHEYLSEELMPSLDPELRQAAMESSVVRVVSSAVAGALGLPEDLYGRLERAGMPVRRADDGFAYHPLLREFLAGRLRHERGEEEWRRINAAVAPALAEQGDAVGAIEHLLEGEHWQEAVAAIEQHGLASLTTSPDLVRRWISLLPAAERALPTITAMEGQLDWLGGDNARAIAEMRAAVAGFRDRPNVLGEWMARSILADLLWATGEVDELEPLVDGWDRPEAAGAFALAPAAAMVAAVGLASCARFEDSERLASAARLADGAVVGPLEAMRLLAIELPRGLIERACDRLAAAREEMQRFDPLNRRHHVAGALAIALMDRGDAEEALRTWVHIRESMRGGAAPVLADATHAWCALLHAQAGRLAEAEADLARHRGLETGARSYIGELAPAAVASLRGDARATAAAAERTLAIVAGGPVLLRYLAAADLVPPLASVGLVESARQLLSDTLALVDEHYPGESGCFLRGRLLALRAWLRHVDGDPGAAAELVPVWELAGDGLRFVLRREWERLEPLVRTALEIGALEPAATVEAIEQAFPDCLPLVALLDHPHPAVRAAALAPALRSGHPGALMRLEQLEADADEAVAGAATRATGRLSISLPPLRFELMGGFAVRRGAWGATEPDWDRPVDARLVRFLLVNLDRPVPEDLIFEALWPRLSVPSARRSLQVAASRARRLLDPPGADRSAIESRDHAYRLVLGKRDSVDADEFRFAAETALGAPADRGSLLEHARSLWRGEPLPEERYSDWAAAYRELLVDRYVAVLSALVELDERSGDHGQAAERARELVKLDPLNEGAHRALMTAYARAGRTGHALRQYLECRRTLVEQLGIEPSEATSRLQARILEGEAV